MLLRNSFILGGSLLVIDGTGSKIRTRDADLQGINLAKVARVKELIAQESRTKTIFDLEECLPPFTIPIKGSGDEIPYHHDGAIELDDLAYTLQLSEHWYMRELRRMLSPLISGPTEEFELDSDECQKRVDFRAGGAMPVLERWAQSVSWKIDVVNLLTSYVPALMKTMRVMHEMGMQVDFDHINAVASIGELRLELDPAFDLKLLKKNQRAKDMLKLARALESLDLGLVVEGWDEKLARLVDGLGEVPDYDAWIEAIGSNVAFHSEKEIVEQAVESIAKPGGICRWIGLIQEISDRNPQPCTYTTLHETWRCLMGPELIELVRATHDYRACQSFLADMVVDRVAVIYRSKLSLVTFGLWLHKELSQWETLGLCSHLARNNDMMFVYVVCPRELFWQRGGITRQVQGLFSGARNVAKTQEVEQLWSLLRFPESADEFKDQTQSIIDAFSVAKYLLEVAPYPPHLQNLETMCKSHKDILLALTTQSRAFIPLATACGLWDDEDALKQFLTSPVVSRKIVWDKGSCGYFAGRLSSITEQPYRHLLHTYVLNCAYNSWRSSSELVGPPRGLATVGTSLRGFAESPVCSDSLMREYIAQQDVAETAKLAHMWMCGKPIREDMACRLRENPLKALLVVYAQKGVDSATLFAEFKATRLLSSIDKCADIDKLPVISSLLETFSEIQTIYDLSDAELAAMISNVDEELCEHNGEVLRQFPGHYAHIARLMCPDLPFAKRHITKQILDSTRTAWELSIEKIGLRSFAETFAPLAKSGVCDRAVLDDYIKSRSGNGGIESLTEQLWACGRQLPAKAVCRENEKFGHSFVSQYHAKGVGYSDFLSDLEAMGILGVIDQCSSEQRKRAVGAVITLLDQIQRVYGLTDVRLRLAFASGSEKGEHFCRSNLDILQRRPEDETPLVRALCPNFQRKESAISRIINSVPRPKKQRI